MRALAAALLLLVVTQAACDRPTPAGRVEVSADAGSVRPISLARDAAPVVLPDAATEIDAAPRPLVRLDRDSANWSASAAPGASN